MATWNRPEKCRCGAKSPRHYCRSCQQYVCRWCWVGPWRCRSCHVPKCFCCGKVLGDDTEHVDMCTPCHERYEKLREEDERKEREAMAKKKRHRKERVCQCLMHKRLPGRVQVFVDVAWIEERLARKGNVLRFRDLEGTYEVVEVWGTRLLEEIEPLERIYRHQRAASDIKDVPDRLRKELRNADSDQTPD